MSRHLQEHDLDDGFVRDESVSGNLSSFQDELPTPSTLMLEDISLEARDHQWMFLPMRELSRGNISSLKRDNPRSVSPPKRSKARGKPVPVDLGHGDFDRPPTPEKRRLWNPDPLDFVSPYERRQRPSTIGQEPSDAGHAFDFIKQPETRPISQEQLVAEVKGIYAGLVMLEQSCLNVAVVEQTAKVYNEQEKALIALHLARLQGSVQSDVQQPKLYGKSPSASSPLPSAITTTFAGSSLYSSGARNYSVDGVVNGIPVSGGVDTGAQRSCVSPHFVTSQGLSPRRGTVHTVQLGSGKTIESPGLVSVPWRFAGESQSHTIECSIIPGCVQDLILGTKFLNWTKTLTAFKSRIKSTLRSVRKLPRRLQLKFIGNEKQRIWGYLEDERASALPDSGSDLMLLSYDYALSRGMRIDRASQHHLELELGDGSRAWTCGLVKGLTWSFGDSGEAITSDFYILEDLPVNIVLSNEFLFDLDVFSRFDQYFVQIDSTVDLTELYAIKLIGHFSDELQKLEEQYLNDLKSPDAFTPLLVQAELVRRDRIRETIDNLAEHLQEDARKAERQRRRQWDTARNDVQTKRIAGAASGAPTELWTPRNI